MRARGESDLGRPSSRKHVTGSTFGFSPIEEVAQLPPSWLELPEALTALLIPLPYFFAELAYSRIAFPPGALSSNLEALEERVEDPLQTGAKEPLLQYGSQFVHACALTSLTLISVSVVSQLRSLADKPLDRRKPVGKAEQYGSVLDRIWESRSIGRTLSNVLGVLLPFYATLQLGGFGVALSMLVAVTAGLGNLDQKPGKHSPWDGAKRTFRSRKTTSAVLLLAMGLHLLYASSMRSALLGHAALASTIFVVPPPLPTTGWSLKTGVSRVGGPNIRTALPKPCSPLVSTFEDTVLTLIAGAILALIALLSSLISTQSPTISSHGYLFLALSVASATMLCLFSLPSALRTQRKAGFGLGCLFVTVIGVYEHLGTWSTWTFIPLLSVLMATAVFFDTSSGSHTHGHVHASQTETHGHHLHGNHSKLSKFLISQCTPGSIVHSILIEKDSRRIAYFGVLNLSFMMVQFFYGFVSGSLGLLTDSIHMLFDCAGLAVGLAAAVMSKWPPNTHFPYGYGKIDTLSGFANGVFLMLVSVEIIFDAFERLWEGHELRRLNELLIVSILGFLVNIVGLTAFGHAHHGHGHSHDHGDDGHGHHHHHDNENMHGIFLHILADALGSVAVIISTLLTKFYGWSGWDPIASCIIAILIFVSAIPLVKSSGMRLLLSLPADVEYGIRNTLQELSSLRGVIGYTVPKFWLEDEGAAHSEFHKEESCGHFHEHSNSNGHVHIHENGNGHSHSHSHSHERHGSAHLRPSCKNSHDHKHDEHNHSHDHSQDHDHDHDHDHSHNHDHDHDHDHDHPPRKQKILGVIHIIASRLSNPDDVRERTAQFLKDRGMDVVVHVEKEGEGRCWCGGGNKAS